MGNIFRILKDNEIFAGYVFILPAIAGTLLFIVIPIFCSFSLSFTRWDLLNPIEFVGLSNYKAVLTEPVFIKILINTIVYAVSTTVFGVLIPLILASVINSKIKGSEFFKTAFFLPFITPMIVIGIIWEWIFDPNIGILNHLLHLHINWLYDTHFAMPALIIVSVWKLIGYNMILFLTGFATINNDVLDAAKTDGANAVQIFTKVTIPMIKPTIFFVTIVTAISSFQVFDLIYVMTEGGPLDSTNVLVYAVYKNAFMYFNIGKASALAYILFAIIFVLAIIQFFIKRSMEKKVKI